MAVDVEGLETLHTRSYQVEAFRRGPDEFVLRGSVIDRKPPRMYVQDDPEPLAIHHMVVDLVVSYPDLVITDVEVNFNTFPQEVCPAIAGRYQEMIGVSIARGFTHKVRERFGGPRGCTHTTALLQAMAPVAVQCHWSMLTIARREAAAAAGSGAAAGPGAEGAPTATGSRAHSLSTNTCHVWDEHGEFYQAITRGEISPGPIIPVRERLEARGIDPDTWAAANPGA